ncbi:aldehyde dehydrogenase family protein [Pararhodobacter oceanensis]|uniref:Betaine-aldehyde dehydrogenase n=1 Tax=Pararhodobacter oceanensis TaxID=2172121 RepID=A0A2T8HQD4_9RHOB|nr:aldehyde dehydrogenase family protein [Pararhodobacter oceanensis]PVH27492.1 betaine-aldehyde dehydrogenase [Pararhodobacter oceanensis]
MNVQTKFSEAASSLLSSASSLFIDNDFRAPKTGEGNPIKVENPATLEALLTLAPLTTADVDDAVAAARNAFDNGPWPGLPATERARLMFKLADLMERDAALLAELETLDNGMPTVLSNHMALPLSIEIMRYYAGWPTKLDGRTIPATPGAANGAPTLTYTRREAVGVVAAITPWNFPLGMAILKLGPALAAGCTVVFKPSELTPLTAMHLARLIAEAGFPEGVVNVVIGEGSIVGAHLANHPHVDKISFTGSTEVGKSILGAARGNLKRVSLELGGKSPVVVFADADLEQAIPGAAMATFLLQGQNCMAGTRLFIEKPIYETMMAGIEQVAKGLKLGDPFAMDTMVGPLISKAQQDRVASYVVSGVEQGAELVTGGNRQGPGHFFEPTLFSNTSADMRIVQEEIFGPVISAQVFDDASDLKALARRVNDTQYGLSGSVWTKDLSKAHGMAHLIRSGQVAINCHGAVDINVPFGGMKQSGWGREYGEAALDGYLETKAITAVF